MTTSAVSVGKIMRATNEPMHDQCNRAPENRLRKLPAHLDDGAERNDKAYDRTDQAKRSSCVARASLISLCGVVRT